MPDKSKSTLDEEQKKKQLDAQLKRIAEESDELLRSLGSTEKSERDISEPSGARASANSTSQAKNSSLDEPLFSKKQNTSEEDLNYTSETKKRFAKIILILFVSISAVAGLATYQEGKEDHNLLAKAFALLGKKGSEQEVIRLSNQVLSTTQSGEAYFYRAYAKSDLGDNQGAIADYGQVIAIVPQYGNAFLSRGIAYENNGDLRSACKDWRAAASLGEKDADDWVKKQCN